MADAEGHDATGNGTKAQQDQPARMSRRSLMLGTAGVALGLGAGRAVAQHDMADTGTDPNATGSNGGRPLSNRIYDVNTFEGLVDIAHDPADIPPPITRTSPETVRVELEAVELEARLDSQSVYRFWTFNRRVPGPFIRVRVGDTVEVHFQNNGDSWMMHNIDFHAASGPGGGAEATSAGPGEERSFTFKALHPGLFVYHCAVPPVALHIANGMYGLILVEPEGGLPPVDREFYVMQGEIYTEEPFGSSGLLTESYDKLVAERPEYFVFNGHVASLTEHYPMQADVGETVRIFFGVGGPNYASSFHIIGAVLDRVYQAGSLVSSPIENVQGVHVAPGTANIVELKLHVPGRFVLVDHALSRAERGLAGYLVAQGEPNPEIFDAPEDEA